MPSLRLSDDASVAVTCRLYGTQPRLPDDNQHAMPAYLSAAGPDPPRVPSSIYGSALGGADDVWGQPPPHPATGMQRGPTQPGWPGSVYQM
eukprot:1864440-Rhodomonas_salina.2